MNNLIMYSDLQYKKAFKEVIVILRYIPKVEYKKIPYDIIKTLENNADNSYNFNLDITKDITKQNISELAKAILEILYRDYWVTDIERRMIFKEENIERENIELEKRKRYNPENIFKNSYKIKKDNLDSKSETKALIEIKNEKWYQKIATYFKKIGKNILKK